MDIALNKRLNGPKNSKKGSNVRKRVTVELFFLTLAKQGLPLRTDKDRNRRRLVSDPNPTHDVVLFQLSSFLVQ